MKAETTQISKARKGKFLQREMAELLNLSERQYRRIERNDSKPDVITAIRIANALGVQDLRELWDVNENPSDNSTGDGVSD